MSFYCLIATLNRSSYFFFLFIVEFEFFTCKVEYLFYHGASRNRRDKMEYSDTRYIDTRSDACFV